MKKPLFLLVSLTALLAACSSPSVPGGGAGGAPSPTPPSQPSAGYPYNPNASATQSKDSRVPYYGEWVWAIAFSSGDPFVGKMSISKKVDESATLKNFGGGASAWCTSGTVAGCTYDGDVGLVGSIVDTDGSVDLVGSHYDASTKTVKWLGIDSDGRVDLTSSGKPALSGVGRWYFYNGTSTTVAFALVQASTTPPVKLASPGTPSEAQLVQRLESGKALSAQQLSVMQARALAAASALADQR